MLEKGQPKIKVEVSFVEALRLALHELKVLEQQKVLEKVQFCVISKAAAKLLMWMRRVVDLTVYVSISDYYIRERLTLLHVRVFFIRVCNDTFFPSLAFAVCITAWTISSARFNSDKPTSFA